MAKWTFPFTLPRKIYETIQDKLRNKVSMQINKLLVDSNKSSLEELDKDTLLQLKVAYELVNDHEEVQNIKGILNHIEFNNKLLQFNPS